MTKPASITQHWLNLFTLIPGYDSVATAAPGEWFDAEAADNVLAFFPAYLEFVEGERSGQEFTLEPWQQALVGCMFGWKRADGTRRYREVLIYIPRKNGKSSLCSALVCMMMFMEYEPGGQMYSIAAELQQAGIVYKHAAEMIARNPELAQRCKCYRTFKSIEHFASGTTYKALTADAHTKHGLNAHFIIADELHAMPNGDLVEVLMTSTGSRRQPLTIHITTADYERPSICNIKHDYAAKVRDGAVADSSFLPAIWEASVDADWTDPKVWAAANPNLGVSIKREYLERECKHAQEEPSYENFFKRMHLNIRTQQNVRWIQLEPWKANGGKFAEESLRGRACFGGMDLSTKKDITAFALVFPPVEDEEPWKCLWRFWIPQNGAERREKRDRVPYLTWARQGFVTLTPGDVVDYEVVKAGIAECCKAFDVQEIAYDPWNATQIALQLQELGATMVEFGQGYKSMSEPSKEFEKLIIAGKLAHGDNPVMNWMVSHVGIESDPAGNIKPSKKTSTERIDGVVASVMALGRAMVQPVHVSPYETRGIQYI